jgi:hypothetical protein|tara:strand:- start:152 stop:532 length:381 start_codon:yes stop_codon:yes gene_type:complete
MKTFLEVYSDLSELKKVNLAQRRKQALRMKRLTQTSAFKKKVEKSKLRVASPEKIRVKAQKLAKQKILDKFYPKYKDMPIAQRVKIDSIVAQKYGGLINKIAIRSVKVVKAKEIEKVRTARDNKDA